MVESDQMWDRRAVLGDRVAWGGKWLKVEKGSVFREQERGSRGRNPLARKRSAEGGLHN